MARVITNGMSLSRAREASLGVLPAQPQWFELEPNSINSFGTTVGKTTRTPISKARARRKGVVTDLDSAVEVEADLTITHLVQAAEEFLFARAVGGDRYLAVAAAAGGYTVASLSSAQAGRLRSGAGGTTLVYAYGFVNAANNGLKPITAAGAAGATNIAVAGNAVEAVDADDLVEVAIAGMRFAAGDLSIDAEGNLNTTAGDFVAAGIVAGQQVHIGGIDVLHQFASPDNIGMARVAAVTAKKLTLAKRDQAFVAEAPAGSMDLLYGSFVRNVDSDHPDFFQPSTQFELRSPGLMADGSAGHEYAIGNWADSLSIAIPLSGKATITLGYVGQDTTKPTAARAANAATAKAGGLTGAFGTASDIARLRVQDTDEAGLSTDFKTATFTLTNNVAGEKVLGHLGPKYLNAGDIEADVENTMLFTNADVIERIRCNKTVGFDWVLRNGDGGIAFDLPAGTLEGGAREFPANQSVTIATTFRAHQDDNPGFTCGISFFPVLPPQPCA